MAESKMQFDSYTQLCQSLLELQNAADTIFSVITDRVDVEHQALRKISSRVRSAKTKVDAIAGSKRAITVYSSAKYPTVAPELTDFVPLFGGEKAGDEKVLPAVTLNLTTGSGQGNEDQGALELFRFFLETSHESWPTYRKPKEGIGGVPAHVKSVVDIQLFNSSELPYHKYRVVDNLAGVDQPAQEETQNQLTVLPAPPQSVLHGGSVHTHGMDEYGFKPTLRQVPTFSLPTILPDLQMVAEISWTGSQAGNDDVPSIAPSAISSPRKAGSVRSFVSQSSRSFGPSLRVPVQRAKSLPQGTTINIPAEERLVTQTTGRVKQEEVRQLPPVSPPPPPPPPPLSPPQPLPAAPRVSQSPPPPPPPPPLPPSSLVSSPLKPADKLSSNSGSQPEMNRPSRTLSTVLPPLSPSEKSRRAGSVLAPTPVLPAVDTERAALLAAIRSPGFKLRKTAPVKESPAPFVSQGRGSEQGVPSAQNQPVDVLSEMASSLKIRRLSMKGASHEKPGPKSLQSEKKTNTGHLSPTSEAGSAKFSLPIAKLHAYIAQKNAELSDGDDWED